MYYNPTGGSGYAAPALTKKPSVVDVCGLAKGESVFSNECRWVYQPHSSASPGPRRTWPAQNERNDNFVDFLLRPFHFVLFLSVLVFIFVRLFHSLVCSFSEREKRREKEKLGRGNMMQIHCIIILIKKHLCHNTCVLSPPGNSVD